MTLFVPSDHTADSFTHDEACLQVVSCMTDIVSAMCPIDVDPEALSFELEAPVGNGFADVLFSFNGEPLLCVEVKTGKDNQSPGGWVRQIKFYCKETKALPLIAVVHDLVAIQLQYLKVAEMPVIDLRTMQEPEEAAPPPNLDQVNRDIVLGALKGSYAGVKKTDLVNIMSGSRDARGRVLSDLILSGKVSEYSFGKYLMVKLK